MDLANYNSSLSSMIGHEIFKDCNMACFNDQTGIPEKSCTKNCTSKSAQFLKIFNVAMNTQIPVLNELSRIADEQKK
jgi:hypothetical protein